MILMNDFKSEPQELRDAMLLATEQVIDSGWYVLGNEVVAFEKQWAEKCGVHFSVGVGNGMDAIEIILRSLNIGPRDEVITTPMTAFASVLAILRAGAIPILADIDPSSALLSIDSVRRCIGEKTKAVLLVHLYGQVRSMSSWIKLCNDHNIALIEDCAQSHLASLDGKTAGSFGIAGAYSFYPTKNLGAIGDGGALVTNDELIAQRAGRIRNYGQSVRYQHPELGMNSRLDEMQAAILIERLKWLDAFTVRRQKIAQAYREKISNPLINQLEAPQGSSSHVYHLYVILCKKRDALQAHLLKHHIQSLIHYPIPIHLQESCGAIGRDPLGLEASENHANTCLSLPCHPQMSDQDVNMVVEAVNAFKGD